MHGDYIERWGDSLVELYLLFEEIGEEDWEAFRVCVVSEGTQGEGKGSSLTGCSVELKPPWGSTMRAWGTLVRVGRDRIIRKYTQVSFAPLTGSRIQVDAGSSSFGGVMLRAVQIL
jgi:hypothetical protein